MFETSGCRFFGNHARILKKYCRTAKEEDKIPFILSDDDGGRKDVRLFDTMFDCFLVAAALGIAENKKEDESKDTTVKASIFSDMFSKHKDKVDFIYYQMIFSDKDSGLDNEDKIRKAFRKNNDDEQKEAEELFLQYVRAGLTQLDKIFGDCATYSDLAFTIQKIKKLYSY